MCILSIPIFANTILITLDQPKNESIIEARIEVLDENNNSANSKVSMYYKYENEIIKTEKTTIYGKTIKEFEITKLGTYTLNIVDENTKGVFSSKITVEKIQEPEKEPNEGETEEKPLIELDDTLLLISLGIIIIILIYVFYKFSKVPKKKKY